ncbi:MAG: ABC transporter permease [Pseudomonadota bacterium]
MASTLSLASKSLLNRRATALLNVLSIAVSVALLSAVERVRTDAQTSFSNTISGTDLILGARSGELNLLLYSVFRIGSPTNSISWAGFREIASRKEVDWTIPLSLGDAHRGFRVVGTNSDYFVHYKYAGDRTLEFASGKGFTAASDAVIGAEVAATLGYAVGDSIVVSHGLGDVSFVTHDDNPFSVSGILAPTGTPVDRSVHVSLEGIDLMHDIEVPDGDVSNSSYAPKDITAALVGLKSRVAIFSLQRFVDEYETEALMAVIPGVALQQLWGLIGVAETALFGVSAMVVLAGVLGLLTTLLVSLNERRREMAVLRSVGARPAHVFLLLLTEAAMLGLAGGLSGLALVQTAVIAARSWAQNEYGIQLAVGFRSFDLYILLGIVVLAVVTSCIPAWRAYRNSLADGLTVRLGGGVYEV